MTPNDTYPEESKEARLNIRVQGLILSIGLLILAAKFVAFFITHSNAVLTDALESIVNVVAGALGLFSLVLSAKPSDSNHPYGHGKAEFISAAVEGAMIFIAGGFIITKSIYNLIYPVELHSLNIGLYIIIVGGLVNYVLGIYAARIGQKNDSAALMASGAHLKSDAYSTLGLIVGLVLIILTGRFWLDSLVALFFGLIIVVTGIRILRSSLSGIMDEADVKILEKIIGILNSHRQDEWIDIHNMRVIKYGQQLHIDCHVTLPWYYNVRKAHAEIEEIDELINRNVSKRVEFFIHVDPCTDKSCPHCLLKDCPVRMHEFVRKIEWNLKMVMDNKQHNLEKDEKRKDLQPGGSGSSR